MRVWQAIREPKLLRDIPDWQSDRRMPAAAFPLSRSHGYSVGKTWRWLVCDAASPSAAYKILVAFEPGKAQFRAWLGLVCGRDLAVLARLEYHPTHKGWHCHVKTGDCSAVTRGVVRDSGRRDRSVSCRDETSFNISKLNALGIAFRLFRVVGPNQDTGLFQ